MTPAAHCTRNRLARRAIVPLTALLLGACAQDLTSTRSGAGHSGSELSADGASSARSAARIHFRGLEDGHLGISALARAGFIWDLTGDGATTPDDGEEPGDDGSVDADITARIRGAVFFESRDTDGSTPVVAAFRVEADGALTLLGEATEADASGRYDLTVTLDSEVESDVLVRAEDDDEEGSILIVGDVEADAVIELDTITSETSVEAEIFLVARSEGLWESGRHSAAALRAWVTADLAARLSGSADEGDSSASADVRVVARAVISAMTAFVTSAEEAGGASDAEITAFLDALVRIHAEGGDDGHDGDAEGVTSLLIDAALEAGLSLETATEAMHAATEAFLSITLRGSAELSGEARDEADGMLALLVTIAVEGHALASDASEDTLDAIVRAGVRLRTRVAASADDAEERAEAFGDYSAEVSAEVMGHLRLFLSDLAANLELTIRAAAESMHETTEEASSDASADVRVVADVAVEAVSDFYDEARADASLGLRSIIDIGLDEDSASLLVELFAETAASVDASDAE